MTVSVFRRIASVANAVHTVQTFVNRTTPVILVVALMQSGAPTPRIALPFGVTGRVQRLGQPEMLPRASPRRKVRHATSLERITTY